MAEDRIIALMDTTAPTVPADIQILSEPAAIEPAGEPVVLTFDDLLPDANGEVVIFAGDGFAVQVVGEDNVASHGVADQHVTASGVDVTGLSYYTFESGLTIYYTGTLTLADAHIV